MKQKKYFSFTRLLCLVLALTMVVALSGCGKKDEPKENGENQDPQGIVLGDGDGKLEAQDLALLLSGAYGNLLKNANGSNRNVTMTLEVGAYLRDMLSNLASSAHMNFDMDWLKTLTLQSNSGTDGNLIQRLLTASINGKEVISLELIMDMAKNMVFGRLPELNDQYLGGEVPGGALAMMGKGQYLPSQEALQTLLSKYLDVAVQALPDAQVTNQTLSHGGISQKVTARSYAIYYSDMLKVLQQVCLTAEKDGDLETCLNQLSEFLNQIDQDGETYDLHEALMERIPYLLQSIQTDLERADDADYANITFVSYTDGDQQVGCKLIYSEVVKGVVGTPGGETSVETRTHNQEQCYYTLRDGEKTAFVLNLGDGECLLEGTGTCKDGKANGNYTLTLDADQEFLQIQVQDFDVNALRKGLFRGKLQLATSEAMRENLPMILRDLSATMDLDVSAVEADVDIALYKQNNLLVNFHYSAGAAAAQSITAPKRYVDVNQPDDAQAWLRQLQPEQVLENLKKAKVPEALLDSLTQFSMTDGVLRLGKFSYHHIQTDSMYPVLKSGDRIVCQQVDPSELRPGDVITYWTVIGGERVLNTHRIVEIYDGGGYLIFATKGDNNYAEDSLTVHESEIIGKFIGIIGT